MKAIIPAAGYGSRLRPHTYNVPKTLLPVAGKPIIGHILDQVIDWGCDEITIVIGFLGEQIVDYVSANYSGKIEYRVQEEALGLGHAVLTGMDEFNDQKELLVILGDTILETDLNPVIKRGVTSIGVKKVDDPRKMGVALVEKNRVKRLIEKPVNPPSNLAIVGVYYIRDCSILRRAILEIISKGVMVKNEYQITDALQLMIDWDEPLETFPVEGWYDCGRPETLLETNRYLFDHRKISSNNCKAVQSILIPPIVIGEGCKIERSIIGPYVSIGADTIIRDCIIRDSILGERVTSEKVVLEKSILGKRVEVTGALQRLNLGASAQISL